MRLHLAQAFSNRAPRGRKHDFKDAERSVRRLIADELILSFVPIGEQRIWRSMTRMKLQLTRDRVRLQNQIECLLEEMRIKLSIVVSNKICFYITPIGDHGSEQHRHSDFMMEYIIQRRSRTARTNRS
jgi:hypothetical protein